MSPNFDLDYFKSDATCDSFEKMNKALKVMFPSCMKVCTQYTPLIEEQGLICEEPAKDELCDVHFGHKYRVHESNRPMHEHQEPTWSEDL
jgi:hypothetical protein